MPVQQPVILFDGVCNFCNRTVNLLIRFDKNKTFHFAALQSKRGQELLHQYHLSADNFDSFILIDRNTVYKKSGAALKTIHYLPWYWKWMQVFWLIPQLLRDAVYDIIARNRYKWFGKKEVCTIPTPDVRSRFLQ